ncbi:MAG TPA: hypothetical protein VN633_12075 [Bryobacteraceae bacterium]|nr:hypothetical protein [Bryobacteraceae bacterium]
MTTASAFFKDEAGEGFGVFYPTDYLIAIFPSHPIALEARERLEENSTKPEEILVLTGSDFVAMSDKVHHDASAWSRITSQISKILGTEELHLEHDLQQARNGGAFLAVYCPTQEEGQRIYHLLKPLGPVAMRRYSHYAIDRIV